MRRFQFLVAALCIALQAIDGIVGALGHSHDEPLTANRPSAAVAHGHGCCSHGHHHAAKPAAENSPPANAPAHDHGDCSLCRHFSQPVVPVAIVVELVGQQSVQPLTPALVEAILAVSPKLHSARGPPALS